MSAFEKTLKVHIASEDLTGDGDLLVTANAVTDNDGDPAVWDGDGNLKVGTGGGSGDVTVAKNGSEVGTRGRINFIEGASIALTVSDDAGNDEVDVTVAFSGAGGAAPWTQRGLWSHAVSGNTAAPIDFTGLTSYSDLMVVGWDLTTSASVRRNIRLSDDNGSTFYSTTGDYIIIDGNGGQTDSTVMSVAPTGAAASSGQIGIVLLLQGAGLSQQDRFDSTNNAQGQRIFVASASPINAIRVDLTSAGNFTGGTIRVFTR